MQQHRLNGRRGTADGTFSTSLVILPLCSLKPWVVAIEGPRRIAADAAVFYCHERKGMQVDFFWGSSDTLIVVLP
jgi:hypothetical protein